MEKYSRIFFFQNHLAQTLSIWYVAMANKWQGGKQQQAPHGVECACSTFILLIANLNIVKINL